MLPSFIWQIMIPVDRNIYRWLFHFPFLYDPKGTKNETLFIYLVALGSPASGMSDAEDEDNVVDGVRKGTSSKKKYPRFGMNKGIRIDPGQINWKGTYVDPSMFFTVSTKFIPN